MAEPTNKAPLITIEALHVGADRVVATVRVASRERALTNPQMAARACKLRPDLPIHACVNGKGPTFAAVMERTPVPHLLEHVVIDLQTQACPDPDRVFTGATRWLDVREGRAQVAVSFADDLVALRAFRDAADLVNGLE